VEVGQRHAQTRGRLIKCQRGPRHRLEHRRPDTSAHSLPHLLDRVVTWPSPAITPTPILLRAYHVPDVVSAASPRHRGIVRDGSPAPATGRTTGCAAHRARRLTSATVSNDCVICPMLTTVPVVSPARNIANTPALKLSSARGRMRSSDPRLRRPRRRKRWPTMEATNCLQTPHFCGRIDQR
jgi:hypothetical protein